MSDAPDAGGSPANELQFDRVEYTAPGPAATCRVCSQGMPDVYYEVNGQPFCRDCHGQLQQALGGGSRFGRFARATLYGSLAGLAGAAIYFGVAKATNHEFGLISIVVGLMVGKAVKKGSNARGGWLYQGLAMALTYTAITLTYIPPMIQAINNHLEEKGAAAQFEQPAEADAAADPVAKAAARPRLSFGELLAVLGQLLFAVAFLIGFAFALPILTGIGSPMGLVIIGIGLYEAWVTNRRTAIIINGPYQIGRADVAGGTGDVEPAG